MSPEIQSHPNYSRDRHPTAGPATPPAHEEEVDSIYVAPNWKLVWWRFKKHKLAVASSFVVILIALVAIMPRFF